MDAGPGETAQYYLHLFDSSQPDLDWRNPEVGDMFVDVLRFWLDRGADGFRIDVAHGLFKEESLRDQVVEEGAEASSDARDAADVPMVERTMRDEPMWDQPEVHDVYRRWHEVLAKYDGDRMLVAEAWTQTPESMARYIREDEMSQAFNFAWLLASWSAAEFTEVVTGTMDAVGSVAGSPTWVLSNHDVERHVTRYGGGAVGLARARAATLTMLALPGSAYLYQGEELGLEQVDVAPEYRSGPVLRPHRRGRPRRLPGADPVERRRPPVRLRAGHRPAVDPAARRLGRADRRRPARRPRLDARLLPSGARGSPYLRDDGGRRRRDPRPRRRRPRVPPRPGHGDRQLRHHPGAAARGRGADGQRPGLDRAAARHGGVAGLTVWRRDTRNGP